MIPDTAPETHDPVTMPHLFFACVGPRVVVVPRGLYPDEEEHAQAVEAVQRMCRACNGCVRRVKPLLGLILLFPRDVPFLFGG